MICTLSLNYWNTLVPTLSVFFRITKGRNILSEKWLGFLVDVILHVYNQYEELKYKTFSRQLWLQGLQLAPCCKMNSCLSDLTDSAVWLIMDGANNRWNFLSSIVGKIQPAAILLKKSLGTEASATKEFSFDFGWLSRQKRDKKWFQACRVTKIMWLKFPEHRKQMTLFTFPIIASGQLYL